MELNSTKHERRFAEKGIVNYIGIFLEILQFILSSTVKFMGKLIWGFDFTVRTNGKFFLSTFEKNSKI